MRHMRIVLHVVQVQVVWKGLSEPVLGTHAVTHPGIHLGHIPAGVINTDVHEVHLVAVFGIRRWDGVTVSGNLA